jgi:hypothetical protein
MSTYYHYEGEGGLNSGDALGLFCTVTLIVFMVGVFTMQKNIGK